MVNKNIQEYLNSNYNKNAKQIWFDSNALQLSEKGTLVISDYRKLEIIRTVGDAKNNNKNVHNITQVTIANCPQLKEININNFENNEQLAIKKCPNLEILKCGNNKLSNLDFLNNCNPEKLVTLSLDDNNFPPQDLTIFSQFKELKALRIAGIDKPSHFTGSCKPLQELKKLEILDINGTDITHGLEYLSDSVKNLYCVPIRSDAQVIDIYEELQSFGGDITKWREVRMEKKDYLSLAPLMPAELRNKENNLTKYFKKLSIFAKSKDLEDFNYTSLHFNHWKLTNPLLPQEAPLRLYQFQNDKVIESESKGLKEPYAILSYVWGDRDSKAMENSSTKRDQGTKTISNSASKAINKSLQALAVINQELSTPINYLWVDQLCMNQENQHEKSLEVPKMGKYYDNSTLTLISLESKIGDTSEVLTVLKKVINSEWFQRSWTFQEGWLSKWTIFMFDDILVDGRAMAGTWALNQLSYVDGGKYLSRSEFNRGTKKIATPVGWVYYRHGYDSEKDKVELTLTQSLHAIKYRQRTEPLDGIYSILGLLPYGKEVKVSYSISTEKTLKRVMKVAIKNGYAEPLSWLGISNPQPGLCWLPQIDKNGSTSVMGSMGRVNSILKGIPNSTQPKDVNLISLTNQGLEFTWPIPHYLIQKDNPQSIHKLESGFEIEGGLYRQEVIVKPKDMEEEIKLSLLGTQESLEQAKKGNILVVLYKEHYGTNKLLALLVKDNGEGIYHRLGLVELVDSAGIKFTTQVTNSHKYTILGSEYQAQIEIPPKK